MSRLCQPYPQISSNCFLCDLSVTFWYTPPNLDGAGLFYGVIHHLLGLKNDADGTSRTPKVIAATHFHEVFANDLLGPHVPIDYMHMEAMLSKTAGQLLDLNDATMDINGAEDETEQIEIHYLYRFGELRSFDAFGP